MEGKDRWTVLIYMVCDDPQGGQLLDTQAIKEMDRITKAALSVKDADRIRVALQIDFRTLPGVWRRGIGESTFVMPESNAATPATLYGFFDWAVAECPAEHYLLIFWGHSRGQFGLFADPDRFDYTAQTLTLEELRDALTAAKRALQKPVDIIAFKDCFMANLEIAYELEGLADYLLASPGLVPVEGWPYQAMFDALTADDALEEVQLRAAERVLEALRNYYRKEANRGENSEVPYSLLNTAGAVPVINALKTLLGNERSTVDKADKWLRPLLDKAVHAPGDRALVDLGELTGSAADPYDVPTDSKTKAAKTRAAEPKGLSAAEKQDLQRFIKALGRAQPKNGADPKPGYLAKSADKSRGLVIDHTGKDFGGVTVFLFPSSPKDQRDSLLTRLADEQAYRRLAISTDTKWADVALRQMPIQQAKPTQDISKLIALVEQLERLGIEIDASSAARTSMYLRRRAAASRNGNLTEADVAEAAQYGAIAELARRLADFAAERGGADFVAESGKPGVFVAEAGKSGNFVAEAGKSGNFVSG